MIVKHKKSVTNSSEKKLPNHKPDIVGVTCTTLTYKSALKIVKAAKEALPNCITAIGGPHVTFWDDKALQEAPSLDIVIRREGEANHVGACSKSRKPPTTI